MNGILILEQKQRHFRCRVYNVKNIKDAKDKVVSVFPIYRQWIYKHVVHPEFIDVEFHWFTMKFEQTKAKEFQTGRYFGIS